MSRPALLVAGLALACGAGELHPFATGAATDSGSDDGSSGASTETGGIPPSGLVYVRCVRTRAPLEVTRDVVVAGATVSATRTFTHVDVYDVLPMPARASGMVAPCDLVWRGDDGDELVLHDCSSSATDADACIAIEPAVSHDGTKVAYTVLHGPRTYRSEQVAAQVLRPDAEPEMLASVPLPNPQLEPVGSTLVVLELATGTRVELPAADGELRRAPTFLHDGRLLFAETLGDVVSTVVRDRVEPWGAASEPATGLFVVSEDGTDLARVGAHDLTATRMPMQLVDGRVAVVATQRVGLLPYRYTNGSAGSAGAYPNLHHLYVQDPDGARLTALFGQHTHLLGGVFNHSGIVSLTQAGDGRLLFVEGTGPFGSGALQAFVPDADGREGPAPHTVDAGDVFRPSDMVALTPWTSSPLGFGSPLPAPTISVPGYADPLVFRGRVRDPSVEPGGATLLVWTKGACSNVGSDEGLLGDPPPPATNGSGDLVPLNALEAIGADNPGCDAGIHRAASLPVAHPVELEPVVDTVEFHELMPRRVQPYAAVHGQAAPTAIEPAHRRAAPDPALPFATPFAVLGGSSLLQHETRSLDDDPFASEVSWALQGAQTSEWDEDEVCGVRISTLAPNVTDDPTALFSAMGHRLRILAELPVRKSQGGAPVLDPLGDPDTSFRVRVPAGVPLVVAGLDCEGRTLSASQVPFSLQPGEDRSCGGCHVRSTLPLRFEETAAFGAAPLLAGAGTVALLAGGEPDDPLVEELEGFGVDFEYGRDVAPILETRCNECHGGAAPAAGLALDLPGTDPGSSWWRIAADYPQTYVPAEQQLPMGTLRKPQLSRYLRFHSARGSLLFWKALGARIDGRSDADATDDVDFGADHPTSITAAELRVLARWIDTGAGAGAAFVQDTWPPVVVARIAAGASVLAVGTVDVGSGIAPDSLVVEWSDGAAWTELAVPLAALAGVVEVSIAGVPEVATLRVRVRDSAGNEAQLVRPRAALTEP